MTVTATESASASANANGAGKEDAVAVEVVLRPPFGLMTRERRLHNGASLMCVR